jgi:hypothetical protein
MSTGAHLRRRPEKREAGAGGSRGRGRRARRAGEGRRRNEVVVLAFWVLWHDGV